MSETRGFVTALAIGLVLLLIAAWHDRRTRLARERAATQRNAPHDLTPEQLAAVDAWRSSGDAERVDATLADSRLVTHAPLCILQDPLVVVVARAGMDDLAPVVARAARQGRPLLLVTGAVDPEVADTFAVNHRLGVVASSIALADADARIRIAELAGCHEADPEELRFDPPRLGVTGRIPRVVLSSDGCWAGDE